MDARGPIGTSPAVGRRSESPPASLTADTRGMSLHVPQVRVTTALPSALLVGFGRRGPCPLRARWVGHARGVTVTRGSITMCPELRVDWSDLLAALIPMLILISRRRNR
jgi:hypothetical protein